MQINRGCTGCEICKQKVYARYKHYLGHASRCLPWEAIMGITFGIWL